MKKIEVYLSDTEYEALVSKIQSYQDAVMEHQDDGNYSDEERAEIINAFGAVPFYVSKGVKRQMAEMDAYIGRYLPGKEVAAEKPNTKMAKAENREGTKAIDEMNLPENIQYETESESGDAADFNFG